MINHLLTTGSPDGLGQALAYGLVVGLVDFGNYPLTDPGRATIHMIVTGLAWRFVRGR